MSTSEAVKMSVEQMCRELLAKALADELVQPPSTSVYMDGDPMKRTGADLSGMANLLADMLKRSATAAITEREWNLQRYKFLHTADGGDITPDDDGQFVTYDDAQAAITAAITAERERVAERVENVISELDSIIAEAPLDWLGTGSCTKSANADEREWHARVDQLKNIITKALEGK
jgi:hypothetical protein